MAEAQRVYEDATVAIDLVPALGFLANNVYILRPAARPDTVALVDFPEGTGAVFALLGSATVASVLLTHSHFDHTRGYDELRAHTDAPIYMGEADRPGLEDDWPVRPIADGEHLDLPGVAVEAVHTPGHTPGSTCYRVGGAVLSGDTLFPGGPGRSASPEALREELTSIRERLLTLPPETLVLPGHGGGTTVAASREEHAAFAARPHDPGLHGDVSWLDS